MQNLTDAVSFEAVEANRSAAAAHPTCSNALVEDIFDDE